MLLANLMAFTLFGFDKRRAVGGMARIRERTLLLWALAGGTPGAFAARHLFRHKTRKQPFVRWLWLIAAAQGLVLAGWAMI
ncbi:DUF1294 domain-containing protein [Sphingobium yanoikuyae]|uniref:DUF1294 domain-containing protein n=2 Tax=Sphingobium yanoikuyae TaxID=13690 RepID=UPI003A522686